LQDLNKELKEIKEHLKAITLLLETKNQEHKNKNDRENKVSSIEKRFVKAQKEKYSISLDHRQARRIAHEWSKKRTQEKNEKKRKLALDSIDKHGSYSGSYTSCETKRNAVGNIQHPSTKSSIQSYRAPVPAYGQQQQ
jgi:hypothetical protein